MNRALGQKLAHSLSKQELRGKRVREGKGVVVWRLTPDVDLTLAGTTSPMSQRDAVIASIVWHWQAKVTNRSVQHGNSDNLWLFGSGLPAPVLLFGNPESHQLYGIWQLEATGMG